MKKCLKALFAVALGLSLPCTLLSNPIKTMAFEDFVNEDGNTQYGYYLVANETNQKIWEFDEETGEVSYCWAGDGDIAQQRVYNYAIRNLPIEQDDTYTVSATFTPDIDSDLSAERTYGIVCWYQDADNYLIYWMQQKTAGDWSGQFYGRVGGQLRHMWMPQKYNGSIPYMDAWLRGEYYDMWWDQAAYTHPALLNQRNILLTTTIGLKVVSSIEEITVANETLKCRKFELHQIVNNVDHLSCEFYVKQINENSGEFYTGVYSEMFNVGISSFNINCEKTDFTKKTVEAINALPSSVSNVSQINDIIKARKTFNGLLSYQSQLDESIVTKLTNAENAVGTYVDNVILALDAKKKTFVSDVEAALNLYESLTSDLQEKVSKTDELSKAIEDAKNWVDPSDKPSIEPSQEPSIEPSQEPSIGPTDEISSVSSSEPSETLSSSEITNSSTNNTSSNEEKPNENKKGCKSSSTVGLMSLLLMTMFVFKKKK